MTTNKPETTAEAIQNFCAALVDLYIEMAWPFWILLMRSIGRIPNRGEFEEMMRTHYLGAPSAGNGDEEGHDG